MSYAAYITPEQAIALGDTRSLEELQEFASRNDACQCGRPEWRYGGVGLCFSCTTGEADASEDYELVSG